MSKMKIFFTMVYIPTKGWTRVGTPKGSIQSAREWVPIVRSSWRGLKTKVSQCTLYYKDGVLTEKSVSVLDTKYNIAAE